MKTIDDGGPAFPVPGNPATMPGMTLRDWFAGKAMAAMLRNVTHTDGFSIWAIKEERSRRAYEEADAMLATRKVTP